METVRHTFEPVFDTNSQILIVGTMPSVLSRRNEFYYGNPQNRFYDVLSGLFRCNKPEEIGDKKKMLLEHGVALYDVLSECSIKGSADSSIKNAKPNDFSKIFKTADIKCVFANGKTAYRYYTKLIGGAVCLPSTSPANASWSVGRLMDAWKVILEYIK